jgi:hypothetical protein
MSAKSNFIMSWGFDGNESGRLGYHFMTERLYSVMQRFQGVGFDIERKIQSYWMMRIF